MNPPSNFKCLICGNYKMYIYYYPELHFNNRIFKYYECANCKSAQINPLPSVDDYEKMYGLNDHTYLTKLKQNEKINYEQKQKKFNHQKYQVDYLHKFNYRKYGKKLLDFGCGSGFYLYHAQKLGFECTGIEFNKEFCEILKEKNGLNITTIDNIENNKFDIIHIGHVLEHMESPIETINSLKKYAHENSIFIIDGPLEKNPCLSRFIIKTASIIKRKKFNTYPPQHLTFTNYNSQLLLLKNAGLKKINYFVEEQMFPFPDYFDMTNPFKSILFLIGRISVFISKFNPKWGNIFHYAGKL